MEDNKKQPQQYIRTPFAYTKLSKNLSLLQQSMLNKVSEHLQDYIRKFFGSELRNNTAIPRPLFSDAEKKNGMPIFSVSYAELGVSINNYGVASAAVNEVLALQLEIPGVDKDGNPAMVKYNIFTQANMSSEESNGVTFQLNTAVVDYIFDMSQGYVRHPADIARIGLVERMPMMYYLLFKKSESWKKREVQLTVLDIKDYLGMRSKVKVEDENYGAVNGEKKRAGRPSLTTEYIKEAYPKFSQFRKFVLDTSINDINRLRHEGLLDVCISYEPVYNGKRKVGNPAFIRFYIYNSIEEMEKATHPEAYQASLFAKQEEERKQQEPVIEDFPGKYAQEWKVLLSRYEGSLKPFLLQARHYGANAAGFMSIRFADRETLNAFNAACDDAKNKQDYDNLMSLLAELIGKTAARVLVRGLSTTHRLKTCGLE